MYGETKSIESRINQVLTILTHFLHRGKTKKYWHDFKYLVYPQDNSATCWYCYKSLYYIYKSIDIYHAVTILVMFPVSNNSNECSLRLAPDYYFVQPQFGNDELEWSQIKMTTPWKRSIRRSALFLLSHTLPLHLPIKTHHRR